MYHNSKQEKNNIDRYPRPPWRFSLFSPSKNLPLNSVRNHCNSWKIYHISSHINPNNLRHTMLRIARHPFPPDKGFLLSPTTPVTDSQIATEMRDKILSFPLDFHSTLKLLEKIIARAENTKKSRRNKYKSARSTIRKRKQWNHSSRVIGNHILLKTTPMLQTLLLLLLPPPRLTLLPV